MSTTFDDGIRIVDMPDIGVVTDDSSVVGEHAGSGRFMATALRDYITSYVIAHIQSTAVFPTVAALRAFNGTPQPKVSVLGFAATRDGGEGDWLYIASDTTSADNTGTILVDAVGHRWYRSGAANTLNILWFGAKADGTTDDAPIINAAIAALPGAGGEILFPPRQFAIASTIVLGNGVSGTPSTRNGIVLRGTAGIESPDEEGPLTQTGTQFLWAGATGGRLVNVAGPTQGCGLQNILLHGRSIASSGLALESCGFGEFRNLSFEGCTASSIDMTTVGLAVNSMNNAFHNIFINMPDVASVQGITLDGTTDGTNASNSCFNEFENLFIILPGTHAGWGIYLRICDSNSFRNVLIYGGSPAAVSVLFDYTSSVNYFPCSNSFYGIDPYGAGAAANVQQWVNNGTPGATAGPNYIYGLNQANGASLPNLANLTHNVPFPGAHYQEWDTLQAAFAATNFYTAAVAGLYRIDYNLVVTGGTGTAGTITPEFGVNMGSMSGNFVGVPTQNVSAGSTSSASITSYATAGGNFQVATLFNAVVGTPAYNLYVNVTRLH